MQDVRVQWQTVFLITSAFYVFSTTFYILCGSGRLQWWALGGPSQVPVRADGLPPQLRSFDVGSRPQSTVVRQFSSPSAVYSTKPSGAAASSEPYSSDTLRRAADLAVETARGAPNHLSPSGDDSDALDRKLSSKSTSSSKTREDLASVPAPAAARRNDHDRDHAPPPPRVRRDHSLSATKRQSKSSRSKSPPTTTTTATPATPASPDEGLRIYESLSESPV